MISLTSRWYIKPGQQAKAYAALTQLAHDVQAHELDVLTYLVHVGRPDDDALISLPSPRSNEVTFFEIYRDRETFLAHVGGKVFTGFLKAHGHLFQQADGHAFHSVSFLDRHAGFIRSTAVTDGGAVADGPAPGVMVEVIANDQQQMQTFYREAFHWQYQAGGSGFAYVKFPSTLQPRLAGIGQADASVPGFQPGNHFYLQVDDLDAAIQRVVAAGGQKFVPPTKVDGYQFAMIRDPEGNAIGLISPFHSDPQAQSRKTS